MKLQKLVTYKINKNYNTRWIIRDVSIKIFSGEIIGLLGPNGAGKTTTFRIPFCIDFSMFFENGKSVKQVARAHGLSHKGCFVVQVCMLVYGFLARVRWQIPPNLSQSIPPDIT